jgi:pimeloyl-ACP methyl ester carboxylesterase
MNGATVQTAPPRPAEVSAELTLSDGRRLSWIELGASSGPIVVVLDGPGSRGLARAAAPAALELGLRLVAPDRPGFGSTPQAGRPIAAWPEDHAALLDHLGVDRAGIFAQSGGTPYALAVALAIPERTTALALAGAVAPLDDPGSARELGSDLRVATRLARRAPWLLRLLLGRLAHTAARDRQAFARKAAKRLPPADLAVLADPDLRDLDIAATREILERPGSVAAEIGLLARPWGLDLASFRVPLALWSGDRDTRHPTAQSRRLARLLGGGEIHVVPEAATFGLLPTYPDALRFAAGMPERCKHPAA